MIKKKYRMKIQKKTDNKYLIICILLLLIKYTAIAQDSTIQFDTNYVERMYIGDIDNKIYINAPKCHKLIIHKNKINKRLIFDRKEIYILLIYYNLLPK
jgi:hypothetical protein